MTSNQHGTDFFYCPDLKGVDDMNKPLYRQDGPILVRIPLLPAGTVAEDGHLNEELARRLDTAIAVSSPGFHRRSKESGKVFEKAILMYKKRMATRATPYGLFVGTSVVQVGENTKLEIGSEIKTKTRIDMSVLTALVLELENDDTINPSLRYTSNSHIVNRAGRIWLDYPCTLRSTNAGLPVNLRATKPVLRILELVEADLTRDEIIGTVTREFGLASREKATTVFEQLVSLSVIGSKLRNFIAATNPAHWLLESLKSISPNHKICAHLEACLQMIERWDTAPTRNVDLFYDTLEEVTKLESSRSNQDFLQVDSTCKLDSNEISAAVVDEMARSAQLVLELSPAIWHSRFKDYKVAFTNRYPPNREVPLLELLSPTFGLGSPFLIDEAAMAKGRAQQRLLKDIAADAIAENKLVVELQEEHLKILKNPMRADEAPQSVDFYASVKADSRNDIDDGNFQLLVAPRVGSAPAGKSVGRFLHLFDAEVKEQIQHLAKVSNVETVVSADLCDWPLNIRTANLTIVPPLREHIVVGPFASLAKEQEIPINEICIGLEDMQFYAKWSRTGQRIRIFPGHLLNSEYSSEPIRFLRDMTADETRRIQPFDWGDLETFQRLPRLSSGKTILRLAQWNLRQLKGAARKTESIEEFGESLVQWRKKWTVPSTVQLCEMWGDDNYLVLDLERWEDVNILYEFLLKNDNPTACLIEHLRIDKWVSSKHGTHAVELVASFVQNSSARSSIQTSRINGDSSSPGTFDAFKFPGSEWLYMRLDCGKALQDEVICRAQTLATHLKQKGLIKNWFFVRYFDDKDHLRLRFQVNTAQLFSHVMPKVCSWATDLIREGRTSSFSFHTYEREVERYGGLPCIQHVEDIFARDSQMVSEIISSKEIGKVERPILCAMSVNALLEELGFTIQERIVWLSGYLDTDQKRKTSDYRRKWRHIISNLFEASDDSQIGHYLSLRKLLQRHGEAPSEIHEQIESHKAISKRTMGNVIDSLVHMHCNRLLGTNREAELLTYSLLHDALLSLTKRQKAL